jgi:hypothetical protein
MSIQGNTSEDTPLTTSEDIPPPTTPTISEDIPRTTLSAHHLDKELASLLAEITIGMIGSATNLCVLLAMWKENRLRTVTNYFIASLALADLLVGVYNPPVAYMFYHGKITDRLACVHLQVVAIICSQVSVFNMLTLSVDRFLAIR